MENPSAMEGTVYMNCILRKWRLSDAKDLAAMLNNKKILNNLRDGLPFPYTEQDARDYICTMLSSDEKAPLPMPSRRTTVPLAVSALSGRVISIGKRQSWATIWRKNTGGGAL